MAEYCDTQVTMDEPSGVEVRKTSDGKGKGLFATKPFAIGDLIFEERPLVCCQFSWNKAYQYLACDFCMRPLESAEESARRLCGSMEIVLPYPECCATDKAAVVQCPSCEVQYCSSACKDEAWSQHHKTLCLQSPSDPAHPLDQLNEAWKQIHYPPETTSIMLLARMIATVIQSADREATLQAFMQFCHRTVSEDEEMAHKLLGEQFVSHLNLLQQLMGRALYADEVQHWLTPEGFRSMVALVGTNGQGVGTSALSIWVKNTATLSLTEEERTNLDVLIDNIFDKIDEVAGCEFINCEGSALFTLQSACNHSCEPNAMSHFSRGNFQLVMLATQNIQAGDEILISYLDECSLQRSRHSRQKTLRENYLFTCHCSKCVLQSDDADETSEDETDDDNEEDDSS